MTLTNKYLRDLTQNTYDSVEGYRKAIETAENMALKQAFERRFKRRSETLSKLNSALQSRGETPVLQSSTTGTIHRTFMTVTDMLSSGDDAVLKRVDEGESFLAEKFRTAIETDAIDAEVRLILEQAYRDIHEGDKLSAMLERELA